MAAKRKYTQRNFEEVRAFLSTAKYPDSVHGDRGKRKNFRRQASLFAVEHGVLFKIRGDVTTGLYNYKFVRQCDD